MTQPSPDQSALQASRTRNLLIRKVRTRLKGSGLDIRELARELVISHPGHPEHGRIYIKYATAEVSLKLTIWNYLGYLDGHAPTDPDAESPITPTKIITTLIQTPGPSAHPATSISSTSTTPATLTPPAPPPTPATPTDHTDTTDHTSHTDKSGQPGHPSKPL